MAASSRQPGVANDPKARVSSDKPAHKRSFKEYLSDVDQRFQKLTKDTLPYHPYYNHLPSDRPFDPRGRYANDWAVGAKGPFSASEAHLQYMTFTSTAGADTLLSSVGGWADEQGNIMEDGLSRSNSGRSGNSTPINAPQRKKISLSDYKKKASDGSTPNLKPERSTHQVRETIKKEAVDTKKKLPPQADGASGDYGITRPKSSQNHDGPKPRASGANGLTIQKSRPRQNETPFPDKMAQSTTASNPNKKPVRPPEPNTSPSKARSMRQTSPTNIPILISPTLPPMPNDMLDMPSLLSPTLPPDIEEYLLQKKASSNGSTKKMDSVSSADEKKQIGRSSAIGLGISGADSKVDEATTKDRLSASAKWRGSSRLVSENDQDVARSKILKLRYGKRNKMRVVSLLKLSSKRSKVDSSPAPSQDRDRKEALALHKDSEKGKSQYLAVSRAEKRPRDGADQDGERAMKRPKSANDERPSTPASTPVVKSPFTTPKKEMRGSTMRRVQSAEGSAKTPHGTSSPQAPGSIERPAPPSAYRSLPTGISTERPTTSNSQMREEDRQTRQLWKDEYSKYHTIGRNLKHAADGFKSSENVAVSKKVAAATAIEAIMAFMLAFIATDQIATLERQPPNSDVWRSMLLYSKAVRSNTEVYPYLRGLCCFLGAVMRDVIHSKDLERLAMLQVPSPLGVPKPGSATRLLDTSPAPTPGRDGTTATRDANTTGDEARKFVQEFTKLKSQLPESHREAHSLWLEGSRRLSEDVLVSKFPSTWSKRARNSEDRGREKIVLDRFWKSPGKHGGFYLPLSSLSTPLEAVRFGIALLTEWCDQENVPWKAMLKV